MNKCSECVHAKPFPQDIGKRICKGAPPQIVVFPHPQGIQTQNMWPLVGVSDDACGAYKKKIVLDLAGPADKVS